MRVGIYGGTFNPVHNGHIRLAQTYINALALDRLFVIPTRSPPHKSGEGLADGAHRLAMCRLAFAGNPVCEVSDIEVCRADKSYTADTLETLHAAFPEDELYLIMGSDMFETLTTWNRWERIFELAVMCAGAREPNLRGQLERLKAGFEARGARCRVIDLDPVRVSSTEVRALVRAGRDIRALVPETVAGYIAYNRLYL